MAGRSRIVRGSRAMFEHFDERARHLRRARAGGGAPARPRRDRHGAPAARRRARRRRVCRRRASSAVRAAVVALQGSRRPAPSEAMPFSAEAKAALEGANAQALDARPHDDRPRAPAARAARGRRRRRARAARVRRDAGRGPRARRAPPPAAAAPSAPPRAPDAGRRRPYPSAERSGDAAIGCDAVALLGLMLAPAAPARASCARTASTRPACARQLGPPDQRG